MSQTKPWYLSTTIWAALVSITASITAFLGVPIDEATRIGLTESALQLVTAFAGFVAILGRLSASAKIAGSS